MLLTCSHYKSVQYFIASLDPANRFKAWSCADGYAGWLSGRCAGNAFDYMGVHSRWVSMRVNEWRIRCDVCARSFVCALNISQESRPRQAVPANGEGGTVRVDWLEPANSVTTVGHVAFCDSRVLLLQKSAVWDVGRLFGVIIHECNINAGYLNKIFHQIVFEMCKFIQRIHVFGTHFAVGMNWVFWLVYAQVRRPTWSFTPLCLEPRAWTSHINVVWPLKYMLECQTIHVEDDSKRAMRSDINGMCVKFTILLPYILI